MAGLLLIAPLVARSAVGVPDKPVPDVKPSALPGTSVPFTQWATEGDGKSVPETNGFAQEGRAQFSARLVLPKDPGYRLNGELLLPLPGAEFTMQAGAAETAAATEDIRAKPPMLTMGIKRSPAGLQIGNRLLAGEANQPPMAWLPFSIDCFSGITHITVGGKELTQLQPPGIVMLALRGQAQVRNLAVVTNPALPDLMVPLHLDAAVNTTLAGTGASVDAPLRIDPMALKGGLQLLSNTPFLLGSAPGLPALDIKPSMSNWKDDVYRSATTYLTAGLEGKGGVIQNPELNRVVLEAPAYAYSAIHLLAFSRNTVDAIPTVAVRYGFSGDAAGIYEDTEAQVPAWDGSSNGPDVVARVPVRMAGGKTGYLYHLRVPLASSANLNNMGKSSFTVELTRPLKVRVPVPDPFEFGLLPAGPPSGAVVLAATMERAPVKLEYSTAEAGNIFFDTQRVVFQARLTNGSAKTVQGRVFVTANGPATSQDKMDPKNQKEVTTQFSLQPGETKQFPLDVTPNKRGWFKATIGVEAGGELTQVCDTSFAVLAPDTRKALEDSPFGVWSFWGAHTATGDTERTAKLGSIIEKGGWRWTYGGMPGGYGVKPEEMTRSIQELKKKYRLTLTIQSPPEAYQRKTGWYDAAGFQEKVVPWLATAHERGYDEYFKVLHESRTSSNIIRRFNEFMGGEPYDIPAPEAETIDKQFANVKLYTQALKKADPDAKIILVNDYPAYAAEYLKRGFPKESFDAIGLESANFMREPERQPDWLSLLGTLAQIKRMQKKYGYDKPVWMTEALYHATSPGSLDTQQQGVIYIREAMLALANGVERMAAAGLIADSADDYYWSNWGGAGFCERDPEYNPKPSYAMYAWLTQILDQAKFAATIQSDSTVLHVLDFQKPDNSHVYPVWTVRGRQSVTLQTQGGAPIVSDVFGNRIEAPAQAGRIKLEVTGIPQYVTGTTVTSVVERKPVELPAQTGQTLIEFDDPSLLKVVSEPSAVLQDNWATPYLKGDFATAFVQEDGAGALRLELKEDGDTRKLLPRYIQLALARPVELKGRPATFTARVKGNGGWGRVMFEMVDGAGRIWTSSGNQRPGATNAADSEGVSFISFDGWQTLTTPLPGQYQSPDQFVHWPRNFDWWPTGPVVDRAIAEKVAKAQIAAEAAAKVAEATTEAAKAAKADADAVAKREGATKAEISAAANRARLKNEEARKAAALATDAAKMPQADGHDVVTYPLKLTKIIIAMQPHILYVDNEVPVKNRAVYLDKIGVIEAAPGR